MSFVQRLRMANMFPIKSDLGNANIDTSGDDMGAVIEAGKALALFNRDILNRQPSRMQSNGIRAVGNMGIGGRQMQPGSTLEEPLKFGGIRNLSPTSMSQDNSTRSLYESYKQPQLIAGEVLDKAGIKPNPTEFEREQLDRKFQLESGDANLSRRLKEQQIANGQANIDAKNKPRVITIADPEDPRRQINVNYNPDGSITPITLPDGGTNPQSGAQAKINAVDAEKATEKANARKVIVENTNATLNLLNDLLDPTTNELTPEAERATGWSAAGNLIPGSMGRAGSAKIDRLAGRQVLDLIGEMKAQSRTGATGFGQMNIKELQLLEKSASLLNDKWLDTETYKKALKNVKERLQKVLMDEPTGIKPMSSHSNSQAPAAKEGYEYVRRPDNKGWTAIKKVGK